MDTALALKTRMVKLNATAMLGLVMMAWISVVDVPTQCSPIQTASVETGL